MVVDEGWFGRVYRKTLTGSNHPRPRPNHGHPHPHSHPQNVLRRFPVDRRQPRGLSDGFIRSTESTGEPLKQPVKCEDENEDDD